MKHLVLFLVVSAGAGCVFPDTSIGTSCTSSLDCTNERVCLPEDVDDDTSPTVCLPMLDVPFAVPCDTDTAVCIQAGYPVDVICDNAAGQCSCVTVILSCATGETVDPVKCQCTAPPI